MASQNPKTRTPLYPQIIDSNPQTSSPFLSNPNQSSFSLYPTIDPKDLDQNLFPQDYQNAPHQTLNSASAPPEPVEEVLLAIPGAILHLIDRQYSIELSTGDLSIIRLRQGTDVVTVMVRVGDEIQWPLAKDVAVVKLDHSHYFFSFRFPKESKSDSSDEEGVGNFRTDPVPVMEILKDAVLADTVSVNLPHKGPKGSKKDSDMLLNYGLTIASKGQDGLLKELDLILENYSNFSVQKVEKGKVKGKEVQVVDGEIAKEFSPVDLKSKKKREVMEGRCRAYWTTLAPNVEDYSGTAAKLIAAGSGQLIKGILWCGDVTVERLNWGNEVLKKRMSPGSKAEISPDTLKRIKRVKRVTKMTEKVAKGVLSGVVKVSGFFTSSVANSKAGKKIFGLLPGEMVIASLDGLNKVCDAVEVAGKNVMSTSSTVTTGLVSHKYGEEAAKATNEGLDAAGHAIGTAWTVFKFRKALNPKSVLKPSSLAKSAAAELKAKKPK